MKPRVTICARAGGAFEIYLNEAGRDLLVKELQRLDQSWDHFHLDHFGGPEMTLATDVPLSAIAYNEDDKVFSSGKVLLRTDEWDAEYFPHVLAD